MLKTSSLVAALVIGLSLLHSSFSQEKSGAAPAKRPVRVAVINGMLMAGLWQQVTERFTKETGWPVETASTGERNVLDAAFREGGMDLISMHSGDVTTNLVADGFATDMKPWTRNELVIVGPEDDPAGIKGSHDGAAALKQIVERGAKFVDFRDIGSREIFHSLLEKSGVNPDPKWLIQDFAEHKRAVLSYARQQHAYGIVGSLPVRFGKMNSEGMAIAVQNDPAMRKPYVVMVANPQKFPGANHEGARALSAFLLSAETQKFLLTYGATKEGGAPFFFPVNEAGWSREKK
jgi:tungstate transport system substrate-binding protein